ncbi:MAG TPA: RND transporter [Anaerolineae bacterium]|nr:RND transporter [Anaerolineae bacterium]
MNWLNELPWGLVLLACVTLGLAPFVPEPHVWEKIKMLIGGELSRPIDIFDLILHGIPWLLLILKLGVSLWGRGQ